MTNPSGPSQRDVTNPAGTSQRESGFRRAEARNWTTRIQVSGWRFMFHRLEHALVRRDTQMLHDPMRSTSRAMIVGVILAVLAGVGAVVWSFLSPQAKLGDADIVACIGADTNHVSSFRNSLSASSRWPMSARTFPHLLVTGPLANSIRSRASCTYS